MEGTLGLQNPDTNGSLHAGTLQPQPGALHSAMRANGQARGCLGWLPPRCHFAGNSVFKTFATAKFLQFPPGDAWIFPERAGMINMVGMKKSVVGGHWLPQNHYFLF